MKETPEALRGRDLEIMFALGLEILFAFGLTKTKHPTMNVRTNNGITSRTHFLNMGQKCSNGDYCTYNCMSNKAI